MMSNNVEGKIFYIKFTLPLLSYPKLSFAKFKRAFSPKNVSLLMIKAHL